LFFTSFMIFTRYARDIYTSCDICSLRSRYLLASLVIFAHFVSVINCNSIAQQISTKANNARRANIAQLITRSFTEQLSQSAIANIFGLMKCLVVRQVNEHHTSEAQWKSYPETDIFRERVRIPIRHEWHGFRVLR